MSDLDLSAAVEAAARDYFERQRREPRWATEGAPIGPPWERLDPALRAQWSEGVLDTVTAAAPVIEAAVREQVAAEIRAVRLALIPGKYAPGRYAGLAQAERIARATP